MPGRGDEGGFLFSEYLAELEGGETDAELSRKFPELLKKIQATGKGGTLTLVLKAKSADRTKVEIVPDIDDKQPKPTRESRLYFVDEDGIPSRRDPRQPSLPGTRGSRDE